jgi:DNA topoisomerase-1
MNLVVVESPAKAKTINKYLGDDYVVIASMGHVRDLPSKDGSVVPEEDFKMKYQIKDGAAKNVKKIVDSAKKADIILLASDPDREGEAIAWNIAEILKESKIDSSKFKRMVFNEITPKSIKDAVKNARHIDNNLVDAQQARLALDYLVGFTLSPILWRKMPGSKSAGRVQSVALRLLAEREIEIKAFVPREYWSIATDLEIMDEKFPDVSAQVIKYKAKKFDNTYPPNEAEAQKILDIINADGKFSVSAVENKEIKQNATPPFTTSLLQQEASKKLGFTSKRTMQIAQKLYEGIEVAGTTKGLITYMRTDGMSIGDDALKEIRKYIQANYGDDYLPNSAVHYKTKLKNAQEAHEAIRPTDISINPEIARKYLDKDEFRLYELIWKRTVACQMKPAIKSVDTITFVLLNSGDVTAKLTATRIKFYGFLALYNNMDSIEKTDGDDDDSAEKLIPEFKEGQIVPIKNAHKKQHFTSPPARFTEASLIKKLEELGIGRPSTYATIISILQERDYAVINKRQFFAEMRGILVAAFLRRFFPKYVEYDFTAKLEEDLDLISDGKHSRIPFLENFWQFFNQNSKDISATQVQEISAGLTSEIGEFIFGKNEAEEINNYCKKCTNKSLQIAIGKYGAYIKCATEGCDYSEKLDDASKGSTQIVGETNAEGAIVHDGNTMLLKTGPYGRYVEVTSELGEVKRTAIPKEIGDVTPEIIINYGALPRDIGINPTNNEKMLVNIGKFGPYIICNKKYYNIPNGKLFTITAEEAIDVIAKKESGEKTTGGRKTSSSVSLEHPDNKKAIKIGKSRYGVYAYYEKKYYTIKVVSEIADVTIEMALDAINA